MIFTEKYVTGDDFIGREDEIRRLNRYVANSPLGGNNTTDHLSSVNVHGLNRIGKTSLMREAFRRIPATDLHNRFESLKGIKVLPADQDNPDSITKIYIVTDFLRNDIKDSPSFLRAFISRFILPIQTLFLEDLIPVQNGMTDYTASHFALLEHWYKNADDPASDQSVSDAIVGVFSWLGDNHIVLCAFCDEVDGLADPKLGDVFGRLRGWLELEPSALQLIFISRLTLSTIETQNGTPNRSRLSGIFKDFFLYGFTNQELEEYFAAFEKAVPCPIDEDVRKEIWHYCGRVPYFLSLAGGSICASGQWDIENVLPKIDDTFDEMAKLMKKEGLFVPMGHLMYGLAIEEKNQRDLCKNGYCVNLTNNKAGQVDKYMDPFDPNALALSRGFATICPYFAEYLVEHRVLDTKNVETLLDEFEVKLRFLIYGAFCRLFGDENASAEIIKRCSFVPKEKVDQIKASYSKKLEDSPDSPVTLGYEYLDHMSFKKYFAVMRQKDAAGLSIWEELLGILWSDPREPNPFNYARDTLDVFYEFRNPIKHNNASYVDIVTVAKLVSPLLQKIRNYIKSNPYLKETSLWREEVAKNITNAH